MVDALVEDPSFVLIGARPVEPHLIAAIRAPDQWYSNRAATQCRADGAGRRHDSGDGGGGEGRRQWLRRRRRASTSAMAATAGTGVGLGLGGEEEESEGISKRPTRCDQVRGQSDKVLVFLQKN